MSQIKKGTHRPILGCDIGNGFGYVSLLQQQAGDPLSLLPSKYQLSDLGMPTTAYVTPPDGAPIVVFQKGKAAEKRYQKYPKQLVHAVKTRLKEGSIALPEVETPVPVAQLYGAIARDLVTLAEEELKNKGIDPIYDLAFTLPMMPPCWNRCSRPFRQWRWTVIPFGCWGACRNRLRWPLITCTICSTSLPRTSG